uniref:Uncharacterized protein n=1 Tax=Arundo donax TaxID=35708 RepID=A0A0A9AKZ9_ARUDO
MIKQQPRVGVVQWHQGRGTGRAAQPERDLRDGDELTTSMVREDEVGVVECSSWKLLKKDDGLVEDAGGAHSRRHVNTNRQMSD